MLDVKERAGCWPIRWSLGDQKMWNHRTSFRAAVLVAALIGPFSTTGCGGAAKTIVKGVGREADNAASFVGAAGAETEAQAAARAAAGASDDALRGPKPAEEADGVGTPFTGIAKNLGEEGLQQGAESVFSNDDDDEK